jgi:hypothetical protein
MDHQPQPRATLSSVERVRASLAEHGLDHLTVREFAASTATASDAAAAIGTTVGRIVKSLVFMAVEQPVLVLASGPNRVDIAKVGRYAEYCIFDCAARPGAHHRWARCRRDLSRA